MKHHPSDAARARARAMPKPSTEGAAGVVADSGTCDLDQLERRAQAADDGRRGYDLALKALREHKVRRGDWPPINADEERQAQEGPREYSDLDCVRLA